MMRPPPAADSPGARLEAAAARWGVRISHVTNTPASLIASGERDGVAVVIKAAARNTDEWGGEGVMRAFGGRGVVRVLAAEPGTALLERLLPGTPLSTLCHTGRDEEATAITAALAAEIWHADPRLDDVVAVRSFVHSFDRYLDGAAGILPVDTVARARSRYLEMCDSQTETHVLHGDLHHDNILFDDRRGWTAIDPKGIRGERAFEFGAFFRNPHGAGSRFASRSSVEDRIRWLSRHAGLDPDRLRGWVWPLAVLSQLWQLEDEGRIDDDGPAAQLMRAVDPG